ncbi:MAG: BtpA/SgcQ family protein [Deltaproteobacteria bacterium]|nr:MAG: BtpA/SgcQ family protein [Deltaproteobacteria bacterium]
MVHLGPVCQGRIALDDVIAAAVRDATALAEGGVDAICVENFGDKPFYPDRVPAHTVAGMTRAVLAVMDAVRGGDAVIGVNVLRNDILSALAIAAATGAGFVRVNVHQGAAVTDQGLVVGKAHESVRYRDQLAPGCAIFADVHVKHAAPLVARPIDDEARELYERGGADAIIVSGAHTGGPTDPARLARVRSAVPAARILVGSGATPETLPELAPHADGFIVGTWLKEGGDVARPVDPARVRAMVAAVRAIG